MSLVTMNQPSSFDSKAIQKEKRSVLEDMRLFENDFDSNIEIGQYEGYRDEDYIGKDSQTETYAKLRV